MSPLVLQGVAVNYRMATLSSELGLHGPSLNLGAYPHPTLLSTASLSCPAVL